MTINEPSASEWIAIGERMRTARGKAGLSVRELARRVDVSASHVSQAERGLASFSVRTLYNVVSELGISMDSLFDDTAAVGLVPSAEVEAVDDTSPDGQLVDDGIVLRAGRRPTIPLSGGTRWERLTPRPESGAEFIEVVYPPAPTGGPVRPADYIRHASREYGVVVSGALTVQVGFDQTVMRAGDSIAFDSIVPHRFWNETSEEVRAIWFIWDAPHAAAGGGDVTDHAGEHFTSAHGGHGAGTS